ncbi:MAG: hypothetical protein ACFE9I_14270 [Candidatus Hermodarchaeota archaeon]
MSLSPLDILNGILGLLVVIVSFILGLIVLSKYFKNKNKNFILLGVNLIFLASGWYGTSTSFFIALIRGNEGLALEMILLLNFIPLPIGLICWCGFYTNILMKEKQKLFLLIMVVITVFFYSVFLFVVFTDVSQAAIKISPVDTTAGGNRFLSIYIIIFIIVLLITGIHFSLRTMKYEDIEMKTKGKFLLFAFPSFAIGGLLDSTLPSNEITLILFRLLLISSIIGFYIGYLLPNWIKKRIIKDI